MKRFSIIYDTPHILKDYSIYRSKQANSDLDKIFDKKMIFLSDFCSKYCIFEKNYPTFGGKKQM